MSALELANRLRRLPFTLPRQLGAEVLRAGAKVLNETHGGALLRTSGLVLLADISAVLISVIAAVGLADSWGISHALTTFVAPVLGASLIAFLMLIGHYPAAALNPVDELREIAVGAALVIAVYVVASIGAGRVPGGWPMLVPCWILTLGIIAGSRALIRRLGARFSWWGFPTVVVGDSGAVASVREVLTADPTRGLRPRHLVEGPPADWNPDTIPASIQFAVVALGGSPLPGQEALIGTLRRRFRHVIVLQTRASGRLGRLAHGSLPSPSREDGPADHLRSRWRLSLKRLFDLSGVILGSPFLILLTALVALLNRLTSPGPLFYGHTRIGQDGRPFKAWKFRTMVPDADRLLQRYLDQHPELLEEWRRTQKLENDPRVTACGRWLRRASLDEIPQVWNVLRGEMSLIGPRPIVEDEIARYGDSAGLYLRVKPGLTGLWQVSGRNKTTYDERVALDAYYVRHWSVWLDLYVFARTFRAVATGDGAS